MAFNFKRFTIFEWNKSLFSTLNHKNCDFTWFSASQIGLQPSLDLQFLQLSLKVTKQLSKKREKILAWVKLSKATKYCSGALSFKAASLGAPHPELQLTFGVGIVNLCVVKNVLQNEENAFIWFWWKSGNTNSSCDTKLAKKFH